MTEVEIDDVCAGLAEFLQAEAISRHATHRELLDDPRRSFDERGAYVPEVLGLVREVREASARAGYYTMVVPESLGGGGGSHRLLYRAWETVFRTCGPAHWIGWHALAHWAKGPSPVLERAHAEVRAEVLPDLLTGTTSMCFAMSEPDAGADVWAMKTRAERVEGGYRINGSKQWITNGPYADWALVFAVTDAAAVAARRSGITAFLIPLRAPGVEIVSVIRMFGHLGGDEAVLAFDDVMVDERCVVGEVDAGLRVGLLGIALGRIFNTGKAIGFGRWALAEAGRHVAQRETFGSPLAAHQGVSFPLAESAMELAAARALALETADRLDRGEKAVNEVAMMKAFAVESALRAVERSMQSHGAAGFTNELYFVEAWHQLRKVMVADGSAELMRRQIGRALSRGELAL